MPGSAFVRRGPVAQDVVGELGAEAGRLVQVIPEDPVERAIGETQAAIRRVLSGSTSEDLHPADAEIRRVQHEMARSANLVSHSYGNEPRRRVRIFPGG